MGIDEETREFVGELEERIKPLWVEARRAFWDYETMVESLPERVKSALGVLQVGARNIIENSYKSRSASINWEPSAVLSEPQIFEQLKFLSESKIDDSLLARQVDILYRQSLSRRSSLSLAKRSRSLFNWWRLHSLYSKHRGQIDGKVINNNDIRDILKDSEDVELRRKAWEASKQIGPKAAPIIKRLVELGNEEARNNGFGNYYEMALYNKELDVDTLFSLLDDLEAQVRPLFDEAKAELDKGLAERFGIKTDDLRPWHYSNHFFQSQIPVNGVNLDTLYEDKDLVELTRQFYQGIGMDIDDVLERSDLYEKKGKAQSAHLFVIDGDGDIRIFANIRPNASWMDTMLHEGGHAVHYKCASLDMPFFLIRADQKRTTEAISMLMGEQSEDPRFLEEIVGVAPSVVEELVPQLQENQRIDKLIYAQWVQVMVRFERSMYENPDQDLNTLWWDLVEQYQGIKRPEGRDSPDYAAKQHIALSPVYYQDYQLGSMIRAQLSNRIRTWTGKSLVNNPDAGKFLINRYLSLGNSLPWNDLVKHATGEPLNPRYFVEECMGGITD